MRFIIKYLANFFVWIISHSDENNLSKLFNLCKNAYYSDIYNEYRKKYSIASSFRFNGEGIKFYGEGDLSAGENSYIGNHSTICTVNKYTVRIGKNCSISHNVRIYTATKDAKADFTIKDIPFEKGNVIIEDYVWIGANVYIGPNITIGTNSIVGANSVVTKNVAPNTIVGGVPAKLIRNKH